VRETNEKLGAVMKVILCIPILALAVGGAVAQKAATPPKPFFTEIKIFKADKPVLTVKYWQDGDMIRREYGKSFLTTYLTTKEGTYIIVNNQDRAVRVNNNHYQIQGKLVEKNALWPMGDVDGFLKEWNAKLLGETDLAANGKTIKALKYTYSLKDANKTMATLWIEKATHKPIKVVWGKNVNIDVAPSKLKKGELQEFQTRIEYSKYIVGDQIAKEMFAKPSLVVDLGDGPIVGKGKPKTTGDATPSGG
jgi:hypothetical protein